jgi:host factor-I protein
LNQSAAHPGHAQNCVLPDPGVVPFCGKCRGLHRGPVHNDGRGQESLSRQKEGTSAMAAERTQNLQDTFLNYVRKNKTPLTIFLVNGVKLQGVVTWFDNFCVLLRRDGHSQLVYKHAISTVMPGQPVQLFEPADEAAAAVADKV